MNSHLDRGTTSWLKVHCLLKVTKTSFPKQQQSQGWEKCSLTFPSLSTVHCEVSGFICLQTTSLHTWPEHFNLLRVTSLPNVDLEKTWRESSNTPPRGPSKTVRNGPLGQPRGPPSRPCHLSRPTKDGFSRYGVRTWYTARLFIHQPGFSSQPTLKGLFGIFTPPQTTAMVCLMALSGVYEQAYVPSIRFFIWMSMGWPSPSCKRARVRNRGVPHMVTWSPPNGATAYSPNKTSWSNHKVPAVSIQ